MSTKNVSKCSYYGKVLFDLTGDTVTESTLKKGATAHDATGTKITGTLTIPESQTKTMDLDMASGDQVVKPDSGKVLSQVTVKKPSTFTAENIKKDVNIGGVVGTYAGSGGGSPSETWVLNPNGRLSSGFTGISFISNGKTFSSISGSRAGFMRYLAYDSTNVCTADFDMEGYAWRSDGWVSEAYRKITFSVPPSGDLLTWLQANGVKQEQSLAIQPSKSLTITSNGAVSVTPDEPYDALNKVDVTVDVASVKSVISDNPQYFYAETADTISKLSTLRTPNTLFLVFITDSHIYTSSNNKQYFDDQMASIKAVCSAVKPDLLIHGGDITNGSETKKSTMEIADNVVSQLREVGGNNTLILIGNHDGNYVSASQDPSEAILESEMLSKYRSWDDGFIYPDGKLYGYRDYSNLGIRVIRMHSYMGDGTLGGTGANWGYPSDEVTWFKTVALDTSSDILILSHQTLSPVLQGYKETQDIPHNGTVIQQAIDTWQNNSRHCIGVIHGHVHWDYVSKGVGTFTVINHETKAEETRTGTYGDFYEYGQGLSNYLTSYLTTDAVPSSSYRDVPKGAIAYGRSVNTVTQALWTAIVVDKTNHHIDFIRFGAGNDVSMDYLASQTIAVTGITLSATSGDLTIGNSITIKAIIEPSNASNQSVKWSSSAINIATVNGGVINAVGVGQCTITATTVDGGYSAQYNLTVKDKIKVNMLKQAVDSSGNPYNNGAGYKSGYRLNSNGVETLYSGYFVTGFIPVTGGCKISLNNLPMSYTTNGQYYIGFYDENYKLLSGCCRYAHAWIQQTTGNPLSPSTNDGTNVTSFTLTGVTSFPVQNAKFMRLSSTSITEDSMIYVE